MKNSFNKIDVVVLWVDGSDKNWLKEKSLYSGKYEDPKLYRDYGTMKYWFRMLESHVSWINKVFFITNGQIPDWLDLSHPKLRFIKHSDFMPKDYLPTFNSAAIELNLHRIEELSENFIYCNDDMYFINDMKPEQFFSGDKPILSAVYTPIIPKGSFFGTLINNVKLINKYFPDKKTLKKNPLKFFNYNYGWRNLKNLLLLPWPITGYDMPHVPSPLKKSTLKHLWELEPYIFETVSKNKLRNYVEDINHYILNYWQIETNQFKPMNLGIASYITIDEVDKLEKFLCNSKMKLLCVNDTPNTSEENIQKLNLIFEKHYPNKSKYEIRKQ